MNHHICYDRVHSERARKAIAVWEVFMDHGHDPPWDHVRAALGSKNERQAITTVRHLVYCGVLRIEDGRMMLVLPSIREVRGHDPEDMTKQREALEAKIATLRKRRDRIDADIRAAKNRMGELAITAPVFRLSTAQPAARPTSEE